MRSHGDPCSIRVCFLEAAVAYDTSICDVFASLRGDFVFWFENYFPSGGDKTAYSGAKRLQPGIPVFRMLYEVALFQEVACFFIQNGVCCIVPELGKVVL